jgi:class 3 adenylate cyclase
MGINGISESVSSANSNFSKAGRVVRTVRLARLVRIYKIQAERARVKRIEDEQMELVRQGLLSFEDIEKTKQLNETRNSKVGAELSDTTTRRVIVIVLLMLCLIPVLSFSMVDEAQPFSVDTLHHFNINGDDAGRQATLDDFYEQYENLAGEPYIIKLYMQPFKPEDPYFESRHELYTLRDSAITKEERFTTVGGVDYRTEVWFNNNSVLEEVALNGILTTLFVSLVMLTGTVVFNADVQNLVLKPIERMMNMVEQVSKDPLKPLYFDHTSGSGEYETRLLEGTIEKITSLLRVGFGEAGAGIISANLNLEDNTSVINPLIPGVRIYAIFGFCDIHHFEDINEKLGKDIMTFVNTIAAIVHNYVHDWKGQCNKNLGNAFLVVWRIGDEHTLQNILSANTGGDRQTMVGGVAQKKRKAHAIDLRRVPGVDAMADMAMIAYLKIVAELNRSKEILAYRSEPRLTNNGTTNYQVSMGFGLHAGWGIEGAVGSLQKVDATYLSPHVNMSARLESSSRQYGTPLLVSQNFFDLMSVEGQSKCRRLDVVTVKGSEVPIGIYTYDCLQDQLFRSKRRHKRSTATEVKETDFYDNTADLMEVFEKDYDLVTLRKHITAEFSSSFKLGVDTYLQGDWPEARKHLEAANELMAQVPSKAGDGPSLTLLRYMEAHGWQAPSSWKGFRPLTSK